MQPLISEFSYGYALTRELESGILGPLTGAPVFPSLRDEGDSDGGYDLQLPLTGFPLYLQFKLSDHLSRSSASEWVAFRTAYYRFHLRPLKYSDQHNLLMDLERRGNEVYYVAPEFHTEREFNDAYFNREILWRSSFFRPGAIGTLPDRNAHSVAFLPGGSPAYLFSENPRKVESYSGKDLAGRIRRPDLRLQALDAKFFDSACASLLSIIRDYPSVNESALLLERHLKQDLRSLNSKATYLSYLALVFFGSQLIIVGPSPARRE